MGSSTHDASSSKKRSRSASASADALVPDALLQDSPSGLDTPIKSPSSLVGKKSSSLKKEKASKSKSSEPSSKKAKKSSDENNAASLQDMAPAPEPSEGASEEEEPSEEADPLAISNFRISEKVKKVLTDKGIKALFPIQAKTFNPIYDGMDLTGRAKTGQGKTLAFVLPIMMRLVNDGPTKDASKRRGPRVLVLAPTRELAKQVHADFELVARAEGLKAVCVYGGSPMPPQESELRRGCDAVIGTPGRVKDFITRGTLTLDNVLFRCLDEADEMLKMGFVEDVEMILGCAGGEGTAYEGQTLLFSATVPPWVRDIARRFQRGPEKTTSVDLVGTDKMKASADVRHLALPCHWQSRAQVAEDVVRCYGRNGKSRCLVFTETKNDANELSGQLADAIGARVLHGDIPQAQREATLKGFRDAKFTILVATDVAARGLDIAGVELVVQIEPPKDFETYIHRSGRTGRANTSGTSVTLFGQNKSYLMDNIERRAGVKLERIGTPTAKELALAAAEGAAEKVRTVPVEASRLFLEAAAGLIENKAEGLTDTDVLAQALAAIAGHTTVTKRSLLTAHADSVTLLFTGSNLRSKIERNAYVWTALRRVLPENLVDNVRRVSLLKDGTGAVFDVPVDKVDAFITCAGPRSGDLGGTLEEAESLPELAEAPAGGNGGGYGGQQGGGYGGGRGGGGYGGGRGGGGYGGGGRGYGGYGGGGRGGGGYGGGGGRGGGRGGGNPFTRYGQQQSPGGRGGGGRGGGYRR
ncbi:hypothetical protein PPROV_000254900 [Pycnococcus provasolii]|uniref:RNA helicase n=1 Tax=Pycnococcus provasolii TaxID=41880 RepID=A0A830H9N6_9CHLO|nr:hypothetical protein PPROV_000254900 [Pycnococcus provasolii]